jgi:hypothetical protein
VRDVRGARARGINSNREAREEGEGSGRNPLPPNPKCAVFGGRRFMAGLAWTPVSLSRMPLSRAEEAPGKSARPAPKGSTTFARDASFDLSQC